jgi:peptidoglycan/LPS O-acetylase OafA/YrhL
MTTQTFDVLDGMRGVAAMSVMLYHYNDYGAPQNAGIAVDFFFILSGFVISHAYAHRLANGMHFKEFIRKRIIRLYPMFVLAVLLGGAVLYVDTCAGHSDYSRRSIMASILTNVLMIPYLNDGNITHGDTISHGALFPANGPLWSLFFEMIASSAFYVMVWCARSTLIGLMLLSGTALVASGLLGAFVQHQSGISYGSGWATHNFVSGFARVGYGFTCGMLLWRYAKGVEETKGRMRRVRKNGSVLMYVTLFAVLALPVPSKGLYYVVIIGSVAPMLVWLGASTECKNAVEQGVARWLGWMSYPVYCLHTPIGTGMDIMYDKYSLAVLTGVPPIVASSGVTIVTAFAIGKIYDEPLRKYLTRKYGGR